MLVGLLDWSLIDMAKPTKKKVTVANCNNKKRMVKTRRPQRRAWEPTSISIWHIN